MHNINDEWKASVNLHVIYTSPVSWVISEYSVLKENHSGALDSLALFIPDQHDCVVVYIIYWNEGGQEQEDSNVTSSFTKPLIDLSDLEVLLRCHCEENEVK